MSTSSLRTVKYILEVYSADGEALFQVSSATPFGAISAGDDLRADNVAGFAMDTVTSKVKRVQHFMQGTSEGTFLHMIMVHLA